MELYFFFLTENTGTDEISESALMTWTHNTFVESYSLHSLYSGND